LLIAGFPFRRQRFGRQLSSQTCTTLLFGWTLRALRAVLYRRLPRLSLQITPDPSPTPRIGKKIMRAARTESIGERAEVVSW
jgi:hypothetical protein